MVSELAVPVVTSRALAAARWVSAPGLTSPESPSTVTTMPSSRTSVAVIAPTTHGTPISRATIAAWQVMPPRSVTSAAAFRMAGNQSGSVISATKISPAASR